MTKLLVNTKKYLLQSGWVNARSLLIIISGVAVLAFQNCSGVSFSSPSLAASNITQCVGCTPLPTPTLTSACTPQQATNLRILFMVDDSGSTDSDDNDAGVRGASIINFLNQNMSNTNLSYSFNYFAVDQHGWDFSSSNFNASPATTFGNATQMLSGANAFVSGVKSSSLSRKDGTDYDTAFNTLTAIVKADEAANPGYSYVVIFMSDGQPNTGSDTSSTNIDNNLVAPLIAAAGGSTRLTLSSVYFNIKSQNDPVEQSLMDAIGQIGKGLYVNDVTDVAPLPLNQMIQYLVIVPSAACPI